MKERKIRSEENRKKGHREGKMVCVCVCVCVCEREREREGNREWIGMRVNRREE